MNRSFVACFAMALCSAGNAYAADIGAMLQTPGDWEMTVTGGFMPPMTENACYGGDESVTDLTTFGLRKCSQQSISIAGAGATVDAVCKMMNARVSVHAIVTATGDTSLHSDAHVHLDGQSPIQGVPSDMTLSIDAHRVGPCRPDERGL
jgi:hypothetical protein